MKFNNTPNKSHVIDGNTIWDSRSVAVNAVIVLKPSDYDVEPFVLIVKRGPGAADYQGYWNVPAGYLDRDETVSECVVREVWEETNVDLYSILKGSQNEKNHVIREDITREWGTNSDPSNNRQNVSFRFGIYFTMEDFANKIHLSDKNSEPQEVSEIKWIPVSTVDDYKFAFKHDRLIKEYLDIIGVKHK